MPARRIHGVQRGLRDAVIALYEKRLPAAPSLDDQPRAGITSRGHIAAQLERLRAGATVQLHRFGELDRLPAAFRPTERTWRLYELRGDEILGVPTWQPHQTRPAEWTV
ncbi:hypothetical protein [Mycobacterium sp. 852014-52144_SCH5372336]|uniref:hypothetical protein n=1 Tax=Mycobacterium sp. 852014-52144_SCH5372336 TaxID=1834115 RepID=UPI0007FDCC8E|nr:hypothetical protein [Mycobacterium sp. 852014-52144_SCH5372336]OBB73214.1 hypothetical protein A5759_16595 [Mycobacterium sp. 852014-52144_SCH5372336]